MRKEISQEELFNKMTSRTVKLDSPKYLTYESFYLIPDGDVFEIWASGSNDDHYVGLLLGRFS